MSDALTAAAILFLGCLLLAGIEMVGQLADRRRRLEALRTYRRMR